MRSTSLITLLLVLIACNQTKKDAQTGTGGTGTYTITGQVAGAAENEMVIVQQMGGNTSDTAYIKGQQFEIKGTAKEPLMGVLFLPASLNEQSIPLSFMVEASDIKINGHKDSMDKATVVGGPANNDYNKLKSKLQQYEDKVKALTMQAEKAQGANDMSMLQRLQGEYMQTMEARQKAIQQYMADNPSSIAGAFFVYQDMPNLDPSTLNNIYKNFAPSIVGSQYVQAIKESLELAGKTAVGQPAPELTLNDVQGNPVSLSSYKGRYVLVDFWASWCGPCRQENPNVVNAYQRFKNKGFTVLGVSLDESKAAWQQAIAKDGLTWNHVSDLKGWKSDAAALYGVQAIPANFLLDKQGVIIAKDLREEALMSKLEEVVK